MTDLVKRLRAQPTLEDCFLAAEEIEKLEARVKELEQQAGGLSPEDEDILKAVEAGDDSAIYQELAGINTAPLRTELREAQRANAEIGPALVEALAEVAALRESVNVLQRMYDATRTREENAKSKLEAAEASNLRMARALKDLLALATVARECVNDDEKGGRLSFPKGDVLEWRSLGEALDGAIEAARAALAASPPKAQWDKCPHCGFDVAPGETCVCRGAASEGARLAMLRARLKEMELAMNNAEVVLVQAALAAQPEKRGKPDPIRAGELIGEAFRYIEPVRRRVLAEMEEDAATEADVTAFLEAQRDDAFRAANR